MLALVVGGLTAGKTFAQAQQRCSLVTQNKPVHPPGLAVTGRAVPTQRYEIVARFPHARNAFTQGLAFYQGALYESTGLRGHSSVRRLDVQSGRVLASRRLDQGLFGEGLAVSGQYLIQLTWQAGKAFIYAAADLRQTGGFAFDGEGWGGTVIAERLVISDGSARLRFIDMQTHRQVATLQVTDSGRPVQGLNELETVDGLIFANVYPTDCIAQIEPRTGEVVAWIDLDGLLPAAQRANGAALANGIAYHPQSKALFVTGKLWPYLYQLRLSQTNRLADKPFAYSATTGWRAPR